MKQALIGNPVTVGALQSASSQAIESALSGFAHILHEPGVARTLHVNVRIAVHRHHTLERETTMAVGAYANATVRLQLHGCATVPV